MYLSIIIPVYNEETRIGKTLAAIHDFFNGKNYDYEVIVVDDGSADETIRAVYDSLLNRDGRIRVIKNGRNYGKGYSVKRGINESKGDYVLFTDADLSTPISELDNLFYYINEGFDIVIASRDLDNSHVRISQPWYREKMGKIFNIFVRLFVIPGFKDTQCGFKLFNGIVARDISKDLKIKGFSFDVEILYLALKRGYRVKEAGVIWENSPESKVALMKSPMNMFFDILRIKRLHK